MARLALSGSARLSWPPGVAPDVDVLDHVHEQEGAMADTRVQAEIEDLGDLGMLRLEHGQRVHRDGERIERTRESTPA
jgi:hypothetical protein